MRSSTWALLLGLLGTSCTGASERTARDALSHVTLAADSQSAAARAPANDATFDGQLGGYLTHALHNSPLLRARYAEWQAEVARIDSMYALPEPTIRYTIFLRPVETRVGPQRHRLGINQTLPWPTVIDAGVEGASLAALAAAQRYEAQALLVAQQVADAYWALWLVARKKRILGEQLLLLDALSEAARARLLIGDAGLSHLSQVQLAQSRLRDVRAGLLRVRRRNQARLREVLNVTPDTDVPITNAEPQLASVAESNDQLRAALRQHPLLESVSLMASSKRALADKASAQGLPRLSLGADWVEVGPARSGTPADSGNDAVSLSVGVSVPIWRGVYNGQRDAAMAEGRALDAKRKAAENHALAQVEQLQADIDDTRRRSTLYRTTLIPQAQTTLEATLGEYQVGHTALASALLAIQQLFELQLGHDVAAAEHRQAWAQLEVVAGRKVRARLEVSP